METAPNRVLAHSPGPDPQIGTSDWRATVESTREASDTFTCSLCGVDKPTLDFGKGRKQCKPCAKLRRHASDLVWRAANKERNAAKNRRLYLANREEVLARQLERRATMQSEISEYGREYYRANRVSILAAERERRERNPEVRAAYGRRYRAINADKTSEYSRRYHARRRGADAVEKGVTWRSVSERDGMFCSYCNVTCAPEDGRYTLARDGFNRWVCGPTYPTVDHVVPVSLGGNHTMTNAVLSCNRCNKRKGARLVA